MTLAPAWWPYLSRFAGSRHVSSAVSNALMQIFGDTQLHTASNGTLLVMLWCKYLAIHYTQETLLTCLVMQELMHLTNTNSNKVFRHCCCGILVHYCSLKIYSIVVWHYGALNFKVLQYCGSFCSCLCLNANSWGWDAAGGSMTCTTTTIPKCRHHH